MAAVPPVASLPPELLDSILGYLAPDDLTRKDDLRACSLVSRTWNVLSKPHLFRRLVLTIRQPAAWRQLYPEHAPDRECRPYWTDVEGTHIPRRTMEDVRHFFASSPPICHAVIDFKLVHFPSRLAPRLRRWGGSSSSSHDYTEDDDCSYALLTDALSLLPRLSTLRLFHFLPSNVDTGAVIPRSLRPGSLSFVKRLFVDLTGRDGEGDLNYADERLDLLLGYLEDLEVLHVSNFTYVTTTTELERFPHTFLRKQRRLNELTLDNAAMKASFFDAVRDSPAAGTIEVFDRTLLMSPIGPDIRTVSALEDLVIRVGPHLTYLGYWVTPDGPPLDFSPFTRLHTVVLRLELHLTTGHDTIGKLRPILRSIPSNVERIQFDVSTATTWNPHWVISAFLKELQTLESSIAVKIEQGSLRDIRVSFWPARGQEFDLDGITALYHVFRPAFERLAGLGIMI